MKLLILQVLFIGLAAKTLGAAIEKCHSSVLAACGDPISDFRKKMGTSFPLDNAQVNELCSAIEQSKTCAEDFQKKCMTPMQIQTMSFLTEGSLEVYKDFCTEGSEIRTDYLKNAPCIDESSKTPEAKEHSKYVEATLEEMSVKAPQDRLPTICCAYALMTEKSREFGEAKCGKGAVDSFHKVVEMAVSTLPNVLCSGFDPEGDTCKAVLPPPGTQPKGTLKNSHIAQSFVSMYLNDITEI
ncbi:uncharacterized protein [Parasteatoda tepidariorum]|nr:uncharacterized protein LOC107454127 [Parasteatoda tepidariorum]